LCDYGEFFVCPGIIDLNVKTNGVWDGRTFASMAAISGGVTLMLEEDCLYDLKSQLLTLDETLHCDIGIVQPITDASLSTFNEHAMAYKTYLTAPSKKLDAIKDLEACIQGLAESNAPLFLNILKPDERNLLDVSPYHFGSLEDRWNETVPAEDFEFGGGYAYDLNQESLSSDTSEDEMIDDSPEGLLKKSPIKRKNRPKRVATKELIERLPASLYSRNSSDYTMYPIKTPTADLESGSSS
jgi:hypothetical protein